MRIKKFFPFLLALLIFIISNFLDRRLNSKKEYFEERIAKIDKDLEAFLSYHAIASSNYNFSQLHLNAVVESTLSGQQEARKIFMSNVTDQLTRAISSFDQAYHSLGNGVSSDNELVIKNLRNAGNDGSFEDFYSNFAVAIQRTRELQQGVEDKIHRLSDEKVNARRYVAEVASQKSVLLNITIAINFLILLFKYIEKGPKRAPAVE